MRIGLITPYLRHKAGGEHETLFVARGLQEAGHDVKVYTYVSDPETCFPELFKQVKVIQVVRSTSLIPDHALRHTDIGIVRALCDLVRPYYELLAMYRLSRIIGRDRQLLCVTNFPAEWAASLASKRLGVPWAWICNEPPFYHDKRIPKKLSSVIFHWPVYYLLDKLLVKSVSAVFSLSKIAKPYIDSVYSVDSIVAHLPYMPGSKYRFPRKKARGKVRALYIASLSSYKRPMDSIEAARLVPKSELFMIGKGRLRAELEAQIKASNLEGRVHLLGRVDDKTLAACYAKSDALIVTAEQTWGLVAVDAMARGVAVITSPETGVSEIVEDGKTGFIVPARNPQAIARKLEWILNHPAETARITANARKVVKRLSVKNYIQAIESEFSKILEARKR